MNLTLEGQIIVCKFFSKTIHPCLTSVVPKQIIEKIENMQKDFL